MSWRARGTLICEHCHRQAPRNAGNQRFCYRLACQNAKHHAQYAKERERKRTRKRPKYEEPKVDYGPRVPMQGPPRCPLCHGLASVGTDSFLGYPTLWCHTHGEMPLGRYRARVVGRHAELERVA